jgi:hypothetical protein
MAKAKTGTHVAYRNSKNGRFVTPKYARRHPSTTERQHVKNPKR